MRWPKIMRSHDLRARSFSVAHVAGEKRPVVFLDLAEAEVERLREALRFYSDGFAYLTPEGWRRIWRDGGQTARAALDDGPYVSRPGDDEAVGE